MPPQHLSEGVRRDVRQRANHLCEYCHTSEQWQSVPFTIDHILPVSLDGSSDLDNLALACFTCNRQKSSRTEAVDPSSGKIVPIFDPRQAQWSDHFIWSSDKLYIIGRTPIGRATVATLDLNRERIIMIRSADLIVSRHPPKDDPIQSPE